ncbi:hypothetical protein [Rhizobium mesosinicum]|uniref:Transposase family protein n=1 Tax=Rhizobium mesosinicum TaxID=335017 RepID=A0ABS7GN75_9HYPH|nr:hypothetical protein [Rhizobium mesosinicum]MBW9051162.1 transposase family protein [Rhizobium mesosinicum]
MAQKRQSVTRFAIGSDDRVLLFGRPYRFERDFEEGIVVRSDDDKPTDVVALTWQDINGRLRKFTLTIEKGYYSVANAIKRASENKKRKLFELSPEDVLRSVMVRAFLEAEAEDEAAKEAASVAVKRSDAKIKRFYRKFEIENAPLLLEARVYKKGKGSKRDVLVGPRQFRRLIERFEKTDADDTALVRQHRGRVPSGSEFTEEQQEHFATYANYYLNSDEPTVRAAFTRMEADQAESIAQGKPFIELCSYSTFLRIVREIDDVIVDLGRSRDKHRVARKYIMSGKGLKVDYPMQILEMDEHKIDLMRILKNMNRWKLLHPDVQAKIGEMGRPWLSVAMDAYSRSVCGMRLLVGDPDGEEAVATLAMAVRNKEVETALSGYSIEWPQCGTPDAVHTDAGAGYISSEFQKAVIGLTGKHRIPPSKHPHLRARVERFFRTLNSRYMHMFSGRTFSNVLDRDNYDPRKFAHLTHQKLAELLIQLIVGAYHNTPHRGLNGQTPLEVWYLGSQLERPVPPPPNEQDYRDIFGLQLTRKIGSHGLTFLFIPYWSDELAKAQGTKFGDELNVRVNDQDLSALSFQDPADGSWKDAFATHEGFKNVSAADWMETLDYCMKNNGPRTRNSRRAKEILLRTLKDVQAESERSRLAAGVASPMLKAKTVENFEKTRAAAFHFSRHLWFDRGNEADPITEEVNPVDGNADEDTPAIDVMNPQGEFSKVGLIEPGTPEPVGRSSTSRKAKSTTPIQPDDDVEVDDSHIVLRTSDKDD